MYDIVPMEVIDEWESQAHDSVRDRTKELRLIATVRRLKYLLRSALHEKIPPNRTAWVGEAADLLRRMEGKGSGDV